MKISDIRIGKNLHAVEAYVSNDGIVHAKYHNLAVEALEPKGMRGPRTLCKSKEGTQFVSFPGGVKFTDYSYEFYTWDFFMESMFSRLFMTPTAAHRYLERLNAQQLSPSEATKAERTAYCQKNPRRWR
jgi:hypothetical protein